MNLLICEHGNKQQRMCIAAEIYYRVHLMVERRCLQGKKTNLLFFGSNEL